MQEDLGVVLGRLKVQLHNISEQYRKEYNMPAYILSRALADELVRIKDIELMECAVQLDKVQKALDNTVQQQADELKRREESNGESVPAKS